MKTINRSFVLTLILSSVMAWASELPIYHLIIKNNRFEPNTISVPAGQKFKLAIENQDAASEEFESLELDREKIVEAGKTLSLFLGPLAPGEYGFFGDFHRSTAKGKIVVQ